MEGWLALERNVRVCAVLGAVAIAFSSILVRLSHASPSTSAIFRCIYAAAGPGDSGLARGSALRAPPLARPAGRRRRRGVLRRRPDPLAPFDRRGRRRPGHRAGQRPGRAGAPGRVGGALGATRSPGAGGASDRVTRRAADLRRARTRRVRARSDRGAQSTVSVPGLPTSAFFYCCVTPAQTCAGRRGRCSTPPRRRPSCACSPG